MKSLLSLRSLCLSVLMVSTATASDFREDRLTCDSESFDLRGGSETETATAHRLAYLPRLSQRVSEAMSLCNAPKAKAPSCTELDSLLSTRASLVAGAYPTTLTELASDEFQAVSAARRNLIENDLNLERQADLAIVELGLCSTNQRHCEALKDLPAVQAKVVQEWRPAIERRVALTNATVISVFQTELEHVAAAHKVCRESDLYVQVTGQLKQPPHFNVPTSLCVDSPGTYLGAPTEVVIASSGARTVYPVWQGVRIRFPSPSPFTGAVVGLTVRGRPNARVLANLGAMQLKADVPEGLLRTLRKARRDADEEVAAEGKLAFKPTELSTFRNAIHEGAGDASYAFDARLKELSKPNEDKIDAALKAFEELSAKIEEAASKHTAATTDTPTKDFRRFLAAQLATKIKPIRAKKTSDTIAEYADEIRTRQGVMVTALATVLQEQQESGKAPERTGRNTLAKLVADLCFLSQQSVLLVSHDIIVSTAKPDPVLDYDFDRGLTDGKSRISLDETSTLFVRVSQVPPGGTVAVTIDGKTISKSRRPVLGGPTQDDDPPARSVVRGSPKVGSAFPDGSRIGYPGTVVIPLHRLPGGRYYELSVCASAQSNAPQCTPPTPPQTDTNAISLGVNEVAVHGDFYLGLRAGMGLGWTFANKPVAVLQGGTGTDQVWTIGAERSSTYFSLPVLLTWYPWGRDPLSSAPELGFSLGPDLLDPQDRLYIGPCLDFGGLGLNLLFAVEQVSATDAPKGRTIIGTKPNISELFGSVSKWHPGLALTLTADADLFRVLFNEVVRTKVPQL